jgi:hypothetical protein
MFVKTHNFLMLAVACGACIAVSAADLPARKPGLWEITTTNTGNARVPPLVEKVCLDAATDQLLYKVGAGASQKMCGRVDLTNVGGKVVIDSECKIAGSTATIHSTTTMSGDTASHMDNTVHYEPALFGKSGSTSTQDAKWLGSCPASMKPGDVETTPSPVMPVPMKMNLNDMFKGSQ